jgi:hypothetical protein
MKKPISERKMAANRANSQKSTGPKTQQGKEAVRNNALKHGMYAATNAVRLPIDDPNIFHSFQSEWYRLYPPRDIEEQTVLESFLVNHWRYVRQLGIENRIFTAELKSQEKLRGTGNSLQPDPADPLGCIAYAFRGVQSSLDVSNRQIARLERSWMKMLDQLRKLHKRPDDKITAPLDPEVRQPSPPQEVPQEPPAEEPSAEPLKNEESKPPAETLARVENLVGIYGRAVFGDDHPENDSPEPGDQPQQEPPKRD